jgi:hypothetical protein
MRRKEAPKVPFSESVLGPRIFEYDRTVRHEEHDRGPSGLLAKEAINLLGVFLAQHETLYGDPIPEHRVAVDPSEKCVPNADRPDP